MPGSDEGTPCRTAVSSPVSYLTASAAAPAPNMVAALLTKLREKSGKRSSAPVSRARLIKASARLRCSSERCRFRFISRATATPAASALARRMSSCEMLSPSSRSNTPRIPSTRASLPSRGTQRSCLTRNSAIAWKFAPSICAASSVQKTSPFNSARVAGPDGNGTFMGRDLPRSAPQRTSNKSR